jgi:serine protease Do
MVAALLAACSGGTIDTTTSTTAATTTSTTTVDHVASLQDVRGAVVRITAEGTFEYPTGTSFDEVGSGSGFLISSDGTIVTNNHVVAGAGLIQVYMDGEAEPLNGRLVGSSECADLAVIDVNVSDAPYLAWLDAPVTVGQEIYVAGFPLGDPEYTLIDGIISKEKADGETDWASIESVIEHTGDTLPGSSGGPIVTSDGQVIGVNYAGDDLGQAFGISVATARAVVDDIVAGVETLTFGVNGYAYEDEYGTGVWVSSVVPASPADRVGIEAGDLITAFAGLSVAKDVTLEGYCDILESHLPDRPFDIEVWRESNGSYYEGVVNSDQVLTVVETPVDEEFVGEWDDLPLGDAYEDYELVFDEEFLVSFEAPTIWTEQSQFAWVEEDDIEVGSAVSVSADLDGFETTWDVPGVTIGVSEVLAADYPDPLDYLAEFEPEDCIFAEQVPYDDGFYIGAANVWADCGGTGAVFIDWVVIDISGQYLINGVFSLVSDADIEAFGHVLETLYLTKDLEE